MNQRLKIAVAFMTHKTLVYELQRTVAVYYSVVGCLSLPLLLNNNQNIEARNVF